MHGCFLFYVRIQDKIDQVGTINLYASLEYVVSTQSKNCWKMNLSLYNNLCALRLNIFVTGLQPCMFETCKFVALNLCSLD